jgi:hypothetical protein
MTDFMGITGDGAKKHLESQKAIFEKQLLQFEAGSLGPGDMDKYLSWIPGYVTKEQADQGAALMRARIGLINNTLESMKAEAEGKAAPKTPLDITIPENWGKAPKEDKELQRMQERAELEMAKAQETLTMKSDMEKFMEKDLDEFLYTMRQTRLERETGFAQKHLELRQWEADAALQIAQMESNEETRIAAEKEKLQAQGYTNMLQNAQYAFRELGKTNKAAFVAWKATAIAETLINTYKAAMGAYSAMASIPYVGPILAVAAAAAAVAAGMAQVSAISSTEPGGGAGGGAGAIGTYSASPSTGLPTGIPAGGGGEQGRTVQIIINGDSINDEEYLERWAEKISDMVESKDVRLVATTSRFAEGLT